MDGNDDTDSHDADSLLIFLKRDYFEKEDRYGY